MINAKLSRRSFFKGMLISGVAVYIASPFSKAYAALFENNILQSPNWNPVTKRVKNRIDGYAKITGEKVFAFDIRAKDMPHWPQEQSHALVLRVTRADTTYEGFDLSVLANSNLMPDRVLSSVDLERDKVKLPKFFGDDFLLPIGKTPAYLGQEVAILIYKDFARFRFAKDIIKFNDKIIKYGDQTGVLKREPWSTFRCVRVGNENPFEKDQYSAMEYSTVEPLGYKKFTPYWPKGEKGGDLEQKGLYLASEIAKQLDNPPEDWLVLDRELYSQSIDLCAMEPDNSNGWYDSENETLHIVMGIQTPPQVAGSIVDIVSNSDFKFKKLIFHPCTTVGYGTKARAMLPMLGVVAALYGDGKPVRLANDRYEQFQSGIKRHPFNMHYKLAINKKTHKIESFTAECKLNGGGRCNYTPGVAIVGATCIQGVYYIPKSDIIAIGEATTSVIAGSNRGYGAFQTMPAFDTLLDEAASILKVDPVIMRMKNLMLSGMKNTQGAIPGGMMRGGDVIKRCAENPIWINRAERKKLFNDQNPGFKLGIGFGCTQADFGSGNEASYAKLQLSEDGILTLWHSGLEVGTGMSTSQSVLCAKWFGLPAEHAHFGLIEWPDLPMTTKVDGSLTQEKQDELAKDPHWTPHNSSTGSSDSAHYYSHVTLEVGRVIFDNGIWPAAVSIWSEGIGGGQYRSIDVRKEDARWTPAGLTADGMEPLTLPRIAKRIYELKGLTGSVGHGYNRWEWTQSDFNIQNDLKRYSLDGLALRWGQEDKYEFNDRVNVFYPTVQRGNASVTEYSALAVVAEVSIDEATGKIKLLSHHSVVECGNVIVPQLVSGQLEGGSAMGIGHALFEYLPQFEDGPGNGTWNFNRYHIPLADEVSVWNQTHEVLPPLSDTDPSKGMAELSTISIVAAITNALADATGHYFYHHPIKPDDVLQVLN